MHMQKDSAQIYRRVRLLALLMFCALIPLAAGQENPLPERFRKWLSEDVIYIIAPLEKEVFLKLSTDRERELFIQAFWKQRDPTPGNAANEFQIEHYRRIRHSERMFGREIPKPGWQTDRGRIYILLGEPSDIQRFESRNQAYPSEVWFYQGMAPRGLPSAFHLLFFQHSGVGEYRLYSPLADGPQALLISYSGDPLDYFSAYKQLREYEPELSNVSMSLIPGESSVRQGRPSLSSDLLINRIESTPQREIKDQYARKFLEYKDKVEVEYSANYIGNESLVRVTKISGGPYFVQYAIEPDRLSVNAHDDFYYTTLNVNGTVTELEGRVIHQFEKVVPLRIEEDQLQQISRRPFSFRDMFPLIPGRYRLSVLIKNEVSKEFTSMERELSVPLETGGIQLTSPLLGYRVQQDIPTENRLRPFQSGRNQVYFQANRVFIPRDDLVLSFQVLGIDPAGLEFSEVRYALFRDDEEIQNLSRSLSDYPDLPDVTEVFSLQGLIPSHYRIRVSLWTKGAEILSQRQEFDITHAESMARPWIYSKLLAQINHPDYAFVLGSQLYLSGRWKEARNYLEKAHLADPGSLTYAALLARLYLAQEDYFLIPSLLRPFLEDTQVLPFDYYYALGRAYQRLDNPTQALKVLKTALDHYGLNTWLLNVLGEIHYQQSQWAEAQAAWKRSLEIQPDQPAIRKLFDSLMEKK